MRKYNVYLRDKPTYDIYVRDRITIGNLIVQSIPLRYTFSADSNEIVVSIDVNAICDLKLYVYDMDDAQIELASDARFSSVKKIDAGTNYINFGSNNNVGLYNLIRVSTEDDDICFETNVGASLSRYRLLQDLDPYSFTDIDNSSLYELDYVEIS